MSDREQFESWMKERFADSDTTGFGPVMFLAWQASRRAALEEAGAFMDKRADEFAACGNHTADTMERIYRTEAIAIRALATGGNHD